jgi:hypothetical protein
VLVTYALFGRTAAIAYTLSQHKIITVDYGLTLAEMIAGGGYQMKNVDIDVRRFRLEGEGIVEFEVCLFHFAVEVSSEKAVALIRAADKFHPWQAACVEHLLAFGVQNSEEGLHSIIGLGFQGGTVGNRRVPYLRQNGSLRLLYFLWWVFDWDEDYRFLAVRLKPSIEKSRCI